MIEEFSQKIEVEHKKCQHELYLEDPRNLRCKKCGAGWTGPEVTQIYESWLKSK